MKLRPRLLAALAAAPLFALVAAACGGNGGSDDSGSAADELTFYTDKAAWEPQFMAVSELSDESIGLGLDFTGYSDADQYSAFIRQSFRTDAKPDLFTWHTGTNLVELVEEDLLAPTTQLWDSAIETGDVSEELREYFTVDGEQYCVPTLAAYWVMYYNVELFDEYSIDEPQTWGDLMSAAATLESAGITPFYQTDELFNFVWFQTLLAGTDPDLYDALATDEADYTDPGVVAVMEQWAEMMDAGYFLEAGVQTAPETLLGNGDVAMINFGTFLSGQLNAAGFEAGTDYDFFVVPNVDSACRS